MSFNVKSLKKVENSIPEIEEIQFAFSVFVLDSPSHLTPS